MDRGSQVPRFPCPAPQELFESTQLRVIQNTARHIARRPMLGLHPMKRDTLFDQG